MILPALFVLLAGAELPRDVVSEAAVLRLRTLTAGLEHPWALAFLPDGAMLVSERPGRLRRVAPDGSLGPAIAGLPAVRARGQGGLLDVAVSPRFAGDGLVYLAYSEPVGEDRQRTALARARLVGDRLEQLEVIFRQQPALPGFHHFGARIVFAGDGTLFLALGDRNHRELAQELDNHVGKVVRILPDGGVPEDNPFRERADALPEIFTLGHRNQQGAALHPLSGELWTHEHGPLGGDEINVVRAGRNYGWPLATHGREYSGAFIAPPTHPGSEPPIHHWTPSIAPSGMAFYDHPRVPAWRGNLFVGALVQRKLVRVVLEGERVLREEVLLESLGERIRDVRVGPEGFLYLLTDEREGRLLVVEPIPFG